MFFSLIFKFAQNRAFIKFINFDVYVESSLCINAQGDQICEKGHMHDVGLRIHMYISNRRLCWNVWESLGWIKGRKIDGKSLDF
jgi:hypothetical protein